VEAKASLAPRERARDESEETTSAWWKKYEQRIAAQDGARSPSSPVAQDENTHRQTVTRQPFTRPSHHLKGAVQDNAMDRARSHRAEAADSHRSLSTTEEPLDSSDPEGEEDEGSRRRMARSASAREPSNGGDTGRYRGRETSHEPPMRKQSDEAGPAAARKGAAPYVPRYLQPTEQMRQRHAGTGERQRRHSSAPRARRAGGDEDQSNQQQRKSRLTVPKSPNFSKMSWQRRPEDRVVRDKASTARRPFDQQHRQARTTFTSTAGRGRSASASRATARGRGTTGLHQGGDGYSHQPPARKARF